MTSEKTFNRGIADPDIRTVTQAVKCQLKSVKYFFIHTFFKSSFRYANNLFYWKQNAGSMYLTDFREILWRVGCEVPVDMLK